MEMLPITKMMFISVFTLGLITTAAGIFCYNCNTKDHGELCKDPFDRNSDFLVNCTAQNEQYNACYKSSSEVTGVDMESGTQQIVNTFVRRMCTMKDGGDKCEKKQGGKAYAVYCQCSDGECNGSGNLRGALWVSALTLFTLLLSCHL